MIVIPGINCHEKDLDCVKEKIRVAETLGSEWIHVDVADGVFTFNKTWGLDPAIAGWQKLGTKLKLEVHLMVEHPERVVEEWCKAGAKRVIVHVETLTQETAKQVAQITSRYAVEPMLAMNPETPINAIVAYKEFFDAFQALAVHPGLPAQKFLPVVLEKISFLKKQFPQITIEVDGGMNPETGKLVKDAGADIIISASYIFESKIPKEKYQELSTV